MIGGDAFLIEAQINDDESIALRVFQYGFAYAVRTRRSAGDAATLDMPAARIVFPDKTTHDYEVDALKVLDQSLEALNRRDMALLFPFCLLKFHREVKKTAATVERRKGLAGELREMLCEMEGFLAGFLQEGRQLGEKRVIELLEQSCALEQIKRMLAKEAAQ
jgi:hypothetical protein